LKVLIPRETKILKKLQKPESPMIKDEIVSVPQQKKAKKLSRVIQYD